MEFNNSFVEWLFRRSVRIVLGLAEFPNQNFNASKILCAKFNISTCRWYELTLQADVNNVDPLFNKFLATYD